MTGIILMHTDRMLGETEGRGGDDAAEAKERQRWPANTRKLGERHGSDSLPGSPEGISPTETLIWGF